MDQASAILFALAAVITAIGSRELLRKGKVKAAEDRAEAAEADAFRRLLLIRRIVLWLVDLPMTGDPVRAKITADAEKETT